MGTGPGGRVLKADVLRIIDPTSLLSYASAPAPPSSLTLPRTTDGAYAMREAETPGGGGAVVPIRGYHRLMVKMTTSSLRVPHMVYSDEVNVDALTAVRDSLRPLYAARDAGVNHPGGKLTHMPLFIKAASLVLTAFPVLNSTIGIGEMMLTYHNEHRIGIAVDMPRGLVVPVVGGVRTGVCWR